jgi:predicted metal-binding membrane protein
VNASSALEAALRRDRLLVVAALAAACLLCWAWLAPMARDMYGAMNGPSAWMAGGAGSAQYVARLFVMWAVMMAGMMLPIAAPTVLLFARVVRAHDEHSVQARTWAFVAGFLLVWVLFSAAAALLQAALSALLYLSPMMQLRSRAGSGAVLLLAGAYELTPLKRACLATCQGPAQFIARTYRPGNRGALRMGLAYGVDCLGCCWALMLLLFAAGVMNLAAIAALIVLMLLERAAPFGTRSVWLSGLALLGCGAALLLG